MKTNFLFLLSFFLVSMLNAQLNTLFDQTDAFFKNNVFKGRVNYANLAANDKNLTRLTDQYQEVDLEGLTKNESIALHINAYNLFIIEALVQAYPVQSPQAVTDFFDKRFFTFGGEKMSLNELEKNLFKAYPDGRYHFALVCGALGCPPIQDKAFYPKNIEDQLQEITRLALNDPKFIRVGSDKVQVSEIFRWYADDFPKGKKNLLAYINQYRSNKLDESLELAYYTYDWTINDVQNNLDAARSTRNLQAITPSILYGRGQFEIKNFANLYTQTAFFNSDGDKTDLNARETFFTNTIQFTYGINTKINVGMDVFLRAVRLDDENSSPFKTLSFRNEQNISRGALSHIGPKIKVAPFNRLQNLSFQALVLFPLEDNLFGNDPQDRFLDFNGVQTFFQVFFDKPLSPSFSLFTQADIFFAHGGDQGIGRMPVKAFLSYFPTPKVTLYTFGEFGPEFSDFLTNYYSQAGLGAKYQVLPGLELELSGSIFPVGVNNGAGSTFNLGIRFVK